MYINCTFRSLLHNTNLYFYITSSEYAGGGRASTCGDVYSFGVLILELLTSKRPTDPMFLDGLNIINFVERSFPDQILQVIDSALQEECKPAAQESTLLVKSKVYECF